MIYPIKTGKELSRLKIYLNFQNWYRNNKIEL